MSRSEYDTKDGANAINDFFSGDHRIENHYFTVVGKPIHSKLLIAFFPDAHGGYGILPSLGIPLPDRDVLKKDLNTALTIQTFVVNQKEIDVETQKKIERDAFNAGLPSIVAVLNGPEASNGLKLSYLEGICPEYALEAFKGAVSDLLIDDPPRIIERSIALPQCDYRLKIGVGFFNLSSPVEIKGV